MCDWHIWSVSKCMLSNHQCWRLRERGRDWEREREREWERERESERERERESEQLHELVLSTEQTLHYLNWTQIKNN